jgi:hypothetical protein
MPKARIQLTVGMSAVDDPRVTEVPVDDPRIRAFVLNRSERRMGKASERAELKLPSALHGSEG